MANAINNRAPKSPKEKVRYGVGEWYGRDFSALTVSQMKDLVKAGFKELDCPFRPGKCNKRGGVCSLRELTLTEHGAQCRQDRS
jgi:hypothetical protein